MKERARALRVRQTDAERLLWSRLRNHRFAGYKFRRQEGIGGYIVDFVCLDTKLIIELDGGQHSAQIEYDSERSRYLSRLGFMVLRFWNNDVLQNTESVLECIRTETIKSPLPQGPRCPLRVEGQGEGGEI